MADGCGYAARVLPRGRQGTGRGAHCADRFWPTRRTRKSRDSRRREPAMRPRVAVAADGAFPPNPLVELMRVPPCDQAASQHRRACDAPRILRTGTYIRVSKDPHRTRRKRFPGICDHAREYERNPVFHALFDIAFRSIADLGRTPRNRAESTLFARIPTRYFQRLARRTHCRTHDRAARARRGDADPPPRGGPARKNPGFRRGFDHSEK